MDNLNAYWITEPDDICVSSDHPFYPLSDWLGRSYTGSYAMVWGIEWAWRKHKCSQ